MRIRIIGKPKTGKTLLATIIRDMVEEHGGNVIWEIADSPRQLKEGIDFLKGEKVIITEEVLPKSSWDKEENKYD